MPTIPVKFAIFITLVFHAAVGYGYTYPTPGAYKVGQSMIITADSPCPCRVISADVELTNNQISPWLHIVKFEEAGQVDELQIACVHSIYEPKVETVPVDWDIYEVIR